MRDAIVLPLLVVDGPSPSKRTLLTVDTVLAQAALPSGELSALRRRAGIDLPACWRRFYSISEAGFSVDVTMHFLGSPTPLVAHFRAQSPSWINRLFRCST